MTQPIPPGYHTATPYLVDPFGHSRAIATHIDDVPPEEVERRFAEMMKNPQS